MRKIAKIIDLKSIKKDNNFTNIRLRKDDLERFPFFRFYPDLIVKNLEIIWEENEKYANITIGNIGNKDSDRFMVYFDLEENPVSSNHRPQERIWIERIAAGDEITLEHIDFQHLAHVDNHNLENVYQIIVRVDAKDMILESNENNNIEVQDVSIVDTLLGNLELPNGAWGITLSCDYQKAYLASGVDGLYIVDISNSVNPRILGHIETPGHAWKVSVSCNEKKAYVVDGERGLQVIDISDVDHLIQLGSYDHFYPYIPDGSNEVSLSCDSSKAYLTFSDHGLHIIDITDSTNLSVIGTFSTPEYAHGVSISPDGRKAYIADRESLQILDISDPSNPVRIGEYSDLFWVSDISLSPDGSIAYLSCESGLEIVDISHPNNPTRLSRISDVGPVTISCDGMKAYILNDGYLKIFNIHDPSNPIFLANITIPNYSNIMIPRYLKDIVVSPDGKAYIVCYDLYEDNNLNMGLSIIDVSSF